MNDCCEGVVLSLIPYNDKQKIVTLFTRELGLQSFMYRSSSKKKSSSNIQPFSILDIEFKSKGKLPYIKQAKSSIPLMDIHFNIYKTSITFFLAEVLKNSLKESYINGDLYEFIVRSIEFLDHQKDGISNFHLEFLSQLSKYLGIVPTVDNQEFKYFDLQEAQFVSIRPNHVNYVDGEILQKFAKFLQSNKRFFTENKLTQLERRELLEVYMKFYELHIPNFKVPKSLEVLYTILD